METFKKRQKEMKRLDRQKEKAARRMQRSQNPGGSASDSSSEDIPKTETEDSLPAAEQPTDM
jgi:hypothetical protein